jgi:hypothetical protein
MVNVSQDVINYFNEGNRQTVAIEFSNGKESFTITEADIVQGGLKIDRYSVTNSKIEVGSAVASELSLKLRNYDGKFDNVSFEGAVLYVKVGVWSDDPTALGHFVLGQSVLGALNGIGNFILGKNLIGDAGTKAQVVWIPCGRFIIDTSPRKLQIITVSALDYMVKFDKAVDYSKMSFPIHVDALIQKICELCSVSLLTDVTALPNHQYSIGGFPSSSQQLTYRQCLQWCAQLTGTCAFMNEDGQLVLKWYEQTAVTVTMNERYTSDLLENDITITGFTCDVSDEATYLAGTNEYALDLSDCGFLTNSYDGVLKELLAARGGFSYRPYSATIKSAPYLFPMDMIRYKDKNGAFHNTIVTNVTFSLNCNTSISGAGETVTSSSYTQSNSGVTNQQASTNRQTNESLETKATKKELHSMMTFTESEGLVITHEGWDGKVQITGEDIRVVRGNNKVVVTDSGISITDGSGSCTIDSGKITFSGIRQDKIWENGDPGSGIGDGAVICNDGRLRLYSAIVIGFGEYYTGLDGSGVNGSDLQYTVFPINGIWSIASRVWDYPRVRRVHVSYSGITFGQGGYYTQKASGVGVKFNKHDTCCVPCAVYGLM